MSFKTTVDILAVKDALPVGCRLEGGVLRPALAPSDCGGRVPQNIIFACHSEGSGRFLLCDGEYVYASGDGKNYVKLEPLAGSSPFMVEDYDGEGAARAVVINGESAIAHTGTGFMRFAYGANLCCGVMHCGRLFGADSTDRLKLRWSGEGGVRDWKEGIYGSGSVLLDPARGEVLNLLLFNGKPVAVRKFGLTVLDMFGTPENFSVGITDTDSDEIYRNTAKVVGGKLLFYTASGLHSFDGSQIRKAEHRCARDISNPAFAVELGGNYFLSCHSSSLGKNVVMCYEADGGESYLIDFSADAMCASECVYGYNSSGVFKFGGGAAYSFKSGNIDFGSGRKKTVTALYIESEGANIEITSGKLTRKFSNASGLIRPKLRGKSFTVKVAGNNAVSKLSATAEECNAI